jgi:4-hydroxy-tetrahydrodipicolinate synthase
MSESTNPPGRQLIVALPTAFDSTGALDTASVQATCELAAASLADGAFVAGTTGEFLALERNERRKVFEVAQSGLGGKRLIAHIGAPSARQAIAIAQDAAELGITEFALLTPLFLPASGDATVRFYEEVAATLPPGSRLYAYLFQARSTTHVTSDTLRRIADISPMVGVKLSGESAAACQGFKAAVPSGFEVFTGSDSEYAQVSQAGLNGVVSGISSCFPEPFDALNRALGEGDADSISRADAVVQEVVAAVAGDIARIKTVLALRGIGTAVTRQAMDLVSDEVQANLRRLLDAVGSTAAVG